MDTSLDKADIIIVGSGHAGAQAAIGLRQAGNEESILILSREQEPPYERPPLSKDYLAGDKPFEKMLIRPADFWAERDVTLRLGASVSEIDWMGHQVVLDDESRIGYRKLIWAGGGVARRLPCPGTELGGIHSVRTKSDVDQLKAELAAGAKKAVVVGGGYIGLEAAAVLRKLGCGVTVIESLDRVLNRVAGPQLSDFYQSEHTQNGVDIRLSTSVEKIEGVDGSVTAVVTDTGEEIPCDVLIVGIGIVPSVGPLIAAGASGANGVDVDAYCRTTLDDIYAIGDCAAHANPFAGGAVIRLESVQNANDMAMCTARSIMGDKQPYNAVPWFWSNQYDLRLQTVGLSLGYDETVLRGDPDTRKFSVIYLKEGQVVALDCVNNTRDYAQGRKLVEARAEISPELLADTETPLKEML